MTRGTLLLSLSAVLTLGCVTPLEPPDYSLLIEEDPRSILVVPVLNNSPEIGAETYFLSTITVPVAERGYYVFPVNMSQELMASAGLSDPGLIHTADPIKLAQLFGADAILYVIINHWEAKYLVFTTTVTVSFEYVLKSGRTGEAMWSSAATMNYQPPAPAGGGIGALVVMVVQAAMTKALPNYIPLARQANYQAISAQHVGPGQPAGQFGHPVLNGPYHPQYRQDRPAGPAESAEPAEATQSLNK